MKANYHTHTWRCNHAVGTEEQYVQAAITRGLDTLGFSDHTPYFFPGDFYSSFRMRPELLPGYVETVDSLRKQFCEQIQLHIGLEAEFYPKFFPELLPYLQDQGVEYLILGQHFVSNETEAVYSGGMTDDPDVLRAYCITVKDAMQTGLFTYFAHPDLIHFVGQEQIFRKEMLSVIREAKSCGIPLEINLLGINEQRHYPNRRFWELAAEESCPVILGLDAHNPVHIENKENEEIAMKIVEDFQLNLLSAVELRAIR